MTSFALCAYARSGKDTAADYLIEKGIVKQKYSFADPLKEMVNSMFCWDEEHSDGQYKEEDLIVNVDIRQLHNFIFKYQHKYHLHSKYKHCNVFDIISAFFKEMDIGYNDEHDVYVGEFSPRKAYQIFGTEIGRNMLDESVWLDLTPDDSIVLTDVRFPNEYEFIKERNIPIIKIINRTVPEKSIRPHVSEQYIETFEPDYVVDNDMTENFFKNLDAAILNYEQNNDK